VGSTTLPLRAQRHPAFLLLSVRLRNMAHLRIVTWNCGMALARKAPRRQHPAIASRDTKMTLDDFRQSLTATEPPAELTLALVGLWWDAKGDWTRAHESAQGDEGSKGSWVHAYLHRKEGDQGNAAYWYKRAGKRVCRDPLDAGWLSVVKDLLG